MADLARPKLSIGRRIFALPGHTIFAFFVVLLAIGVIAAAAFLHVSVDTSISREAVEALGGMGTMVAVSYIGGSVVQASSILTMLGNRFGRFMPQAAPPAADQ